ncbi:MAG TPA: tRNA-dihydrouridine synthase [Prolixibacteraceae bacterium]|nr:tRNA-dihydrouridine synthase [Prolixibacteraceae bacterium]
MANFWNELNRPIFALAPMEDVTDTSFREVIATISDPRYLHILYTEFTSVDGMNHAIGKKRVGERLIVSDSEKQILKQKNIKLVAQIWGRKPELFHKIAAEITSEFDFDGLDINMGCPVKNVVKNGCCSALIGEPSLAQEIILATKEATHLPVSVKTRTGIKGHDTENWIANIMETKPAAVILHGRTQKQQSDGLANWEEIAKGARVRDQINPDTLFLGNGDVLSVQQGEKLCQIYGLDGVMIGRGIFHNPWFFDPTKTNLTKQEKLDQLLFHTKLFERNWSGRKNLNILKRFYKIYTNDFPGAAAIRANLMEAKTYSDVYQTVDSAE